MFVSHKGVTQLLLCVIHCLLRVYHAPFFVVNANRARNRVATNCVRREISISVATNGLLGKLIC